MYVPQNVSQTPYLLKTSFSSVCRKKSAAMQFFVPHNVISHNYHIPSYSHAYSKNYWGSYTGIDAYTREREYERIMSYTCIYVYT